MVKCGEEYKTIRYNFNKQNKNNLFISIYTKIFLIILKFKIIMTSMKHAVKLFYKN